MKKKKYILWSSSTILLLAIALIFFWQNDLLHTVPHDQTNHEDQKPTVGADVSDDAAHSVEIREISNPVETIAGEDPPVPVTPSVEEPLIPSEEVDIVLIGTELEGMFLARAAADEGLRVKILDPREAIGGQLLQGEMLFLDETIDDARKSLVQGRIKALFNGFKSGRIRSLSEFSTFYNDHLLQDLPIESGINIKKVKTQPGPNEEPVIHLVEYTTSKGERKAIEAAYWVDNTDHAALIHHLDVERMTGLEQFYKLDKLEYMASSMMMKFKNVDWKKFESEFNSLTRAQINERYGGGYVNESFALGLVGVTNAYKPTSDRLHLRGLNGLNQKNGEVIINAFLIFDVNPAVDASVAEAIELGRKEIPLILEHFRTKLPGWEHAEVNDFPPYLYIREYNHYETDYVLQVADVLSGKMFWDNVSIAGYPLDLQGVSTVKWGIEMGRPDKYGMPLRSFLLKGYENVLVAGKLVGASAVAYGSARIQPNTSLAAESIGIILGQIHGKKSLKQLTAADMPALHKYIEDQYGIKLTGISATNKIEGWTDEEIAKLNTGEIVYPQYIHIRK